MKVINVNKNKFNRLISQIETKLQSPKPLPIQNKSQGNKEIHYYWRFPNPQGYNGYLFAAILIVANSGVAVTLDSNNHTIRLWQDTHYSQKIDRAIDIIKMTIHSLP